MAMAETSAAYSGTRALVVLAFLWTSAAGAGEPHRWVDDSGEVHYTDAPPPASARTAAAAADQAERSRRDRVLWRSYSSVADIERTRDRRLEAVDGEIALAEHRVEQARYRIERYDRLLADLPEDNEHRAEMKQGRADARERLERRREALEKVRAKRLRMEARFARDIERFRELMAERE